VSAQTDGERTRNERLGYLKAETAENSYILRRGDREQLVTAWGLYRQGKRSDPLIELEDNYGATYTLDLAALEGVVDIPPQAVALWDVDEQILKLRGDG
jgi:hypothetical protein